MSTKRILTISSCLILSTCMMQSAGRQQGSDQPTADAIQAAQAQSNQDAAYQESLQIEREQQYDLQQQRIMQQRQQAQQFAIHAQQRAENINGAQPSADGRRTGRRPPPPSSYDPARQNYDPAAGPYAKKSSWNAALDAATGHINPDNINYGGLLSQWHLAMAQETIGNLYFYIVVVESITLLIIFLYAFHLIVERRHRLQIAGGVVTQLYNQYVLARNKAYEAIRAHNALVEDKEDRLDSLLCDERPPELTIQVSRAGNPGLDNSGHMINHAAASRSAKTTNDSTANGLQIESVIDSPEPRAEDDGIPEKAPIPLAAIDVVGAKGEADDPIASKSNSVEDQLEVTKRQVETLQSRLRSKNIRINELEDALSVTSSTTKYPEL